MADTAATRAEDRRPGAFGSEVMALSELWLKQVTVRTTRAPAAWARETRFTRSWLWYPFQPAPLWFSVPSALASTLKYARVVRSWTSNPAD